MKKNQRKPNVKEHEGCNYWWSKTDYSVHGALCQQALFHSIPQESSRCFRYHLNSNVASKLASPFLKTLLLLPAPPITPWCVCRGQRITWGLFLSFMWVPGIEHRNQDFLRKHLYSMRSHQPFSFLNLSDRRKSRTLKTAHEVNLEFSGKYFGNMYGES